jgi:threonyl-tRNA synthetase
VAVGKKEVAENTVSVRQLGSDKSVVMSVEEFTQKVLIDSENPLQRQ